MKALVLYSGGLDSTILLHWAKTIYDITAVSFDYGQRHKKELKYAIDNCLELDIPHIVIKLPFFKQFNSSLLGTEEIPEGHYKDKSMHSTVVPFRNGIMLSIAIGLAENLGIKRVLLASHAGDHAIYPDCREEFTYFMDKASRKGTYNKVRVISPFNKKTKKQIVKIGRKLNIDFDKTWSCYKGKNKPCGKCGTCVERKEALMSG